MKTLDLIQGSEEWIATRGRYNTASEAPVMMGEGKISRQELVRMRATGSEQEFSRWVIEVLFARGHEVEEMARPIAEEIIGEELYPVTGVSDVVVLLASFDGLTLMGDVAWECKQWNEEKAEQVRQGVLPPADYWQVVQQLCVSGAERLLYMVTDGTRDKCEHMYVTLAEEDAKKLVAGWAQFNDDVFAYVPTEVVPEPIGRAPEDLPALRIEVKGMVTASNIDAFRDHAMAVFEGISTDLNTDEDFACAEKTVKWCKDVEKKLEAAKTAALEQTSSIDQLFRAMDAVSWESRTKRMELDKLVKARKQSIRAEIINEARADLEKIIESVVMGFPINGIGIAVEHDFAGAMKNKRTIRSLRDAVADHLAAVKIEVSQMASVINANLSWFVAGFDEAERALFPDISDLCRKEADAFHAICRTRVEDHAKAQEAKAAAAAAREEARAATEAAAAPAAQKPAPVDPAPEPVPMRSEGVSKATGRSAGSFAEWWQEIGSGMAFLPGEDAEQHACRVARAAWQAGIESHLSKRSPRNG